MRSYSDRKLDPDLFIFGVLFAILLPFGLSLFSGYRQSGFPPSSLWKYTPLGLVFSLSPSDWEIGSASGFDWKFSFSLDYFSVFIKTCFLESLFYWLAFRKAGKFFWLFPLFLANGISHPIVFFVFPALSSHYIVALLTGEISVLLIENTIALAILNQLVTSHSPHLPTRLQMMSWIVLANLFSWQMGIYF